MYFGLHAGRYGIGTLRVKAFLCKSDCCGVDCGTHGECLDGSGVCSCDSNYIGEFCDIHCHCNAHGTFIISNELRTSAVTCSAGSCQCSGDYIGPACETPCDCNGHGTQVDIASARAANSCSAGSCQCSGDYSGPACECTNGGVFEPTNGTIKCSCPDGFMGLYCEFPIAGNFQDSGTVSVNGYSSYERDLFRVRCSNATHGPSLMFSNIDTEGNYDYIYILDASDEYWSNAALSRMMNMDTGTVEFSTSEDVEHLLCCLSGTLSGTHFVVFADTAADTAPCGAGSWKKPDLALDTTNGSVPTLTIHTTGPIIVMFTSDGSIERRGFNATFSC